MRLRWHGLPHRRPRHLRAGLTLAALSLVALTACGGKDDSADTDLGDTRFTAIDGEILTMSCGFGSCHGSGSGGLTLDGTDDYNQLVNVAATVEGETLVIPGDADGSYLIKKMEGAAGVVGDPMPPPAGGLDARSIARIRAWIDAGAAND